MILDKERVTPLGNINIRIGCGIDRKGRILEVLSFKLVATAYKVGLPGPQIEPRIECMDASVEIRSFASAKRLEPDSQRSADGAAGRIQALIT